ncbi:AGE family epimerase/isomerase [Cupriavidus basilensis]|uniref:AGE family epimerase/isomerase n=1 Tax=Cupriavidus basilensis TaxID=68895 RepID=UPI00283BC6F4|nr:AGE family epimerase/isomerase [Cupriavidus basilensis]MDR3380316.1 AGE family epimerase/isomerase [Cupriavidus basilensis]
MNVTPPLATAGADSKAASFAALRAHYDTVVLPLWSGPGWNATMQLPYEALSGTDCQPLPVARYRAMACARQLYVFSQCDGPEGAAHAAHAARLFASLGGRFADGGQGGFIYSIDAQGQPLDTTKDLYTHAFVVFACAAYFKRSGSAQARALLDGTTRLIEARFATADGLYHAALAQDFRPLGGPPQQNPIMHLTEAYLAAFEVTGERRYADRLAGIAAAVLATFVDPATGCIAELPMCTDRAGNRVEPGHQFEWFSLLASAPALFEGSGLAQALARAFGFAMQHGVDTSTMGVAAALHLDGSPRDPIQRIWAQTEFARALAVRGDTVALAHLQAWLKAYPARFLHAGGWHECLSPAGKVERAEMPSTTPYHLATAYQALPRD